MWHVYKPLVKCFRGSWCPDCQVQIFLMSFLLFCINNGPVIVTGMNSVGTHFLFMGWVHCFKDTDWYRYRVTSPAIIFWVCPFTWVLFLLFLQIDTGWLNAVPSNHHQLSLSLKLREDESFDNLANVYDRKWVPTLFMPVTITGPLMIHKRSFW